MTNLLEKINHIIEDSMKANHIPGVALAVLKNNEVILSQGYGKTTVEEWGTPIHSNTLFRIASVSKLFTGTLMMILVEKGLIDLDQPVQHYVPWFTAADRKRSELITIRMLLSHSSSLPTGGDLSFHHNEEGLYQYMKEVVPTLPILFEPGTAYSYGNHSLNIAGFVAEQVTNKKFEQLMQELLFQPLDMKQTTYDPLRAMTCSLALPHDKETNGHLTVADRFYDNTACYPSYYSFSSIEDLTKFAIMHLQNGFYNQQEILSTASVQEMRTQQSKWYTLTNAGCGITFFQESKEGIERFWHYGQYSHQYSSQFILVPEKGIAVIALANGENIFQAGYEIVDELLKDEFLTGNNLEVAFSTKNLDLGHYEGTYLHSYYGLFDLYQITGKTFLKQNENSYELVQHCLDTYLAKDTEGNIVFTVGFPNQTDSSSTRCIVINSKACPEFMKSYSPNPKDWQSWEGTYSDGRDGYEVWIKNMNLIIKDQQTQNELVGEAIEKNQFMTKEYGLVSFIEVNETIHLEFDFAWRFPKKSVNVSAASIQ